MNIFVVLIHVVACIALIAIVLLQTGKGAEMGAAFGGASQTLFGGTGGTSFMSKLTTGAAIVFMLTCLWLSYRPSTAANRSLMQDVPTEQSSPAPPSPAPVLPEARPVQPEQQSTAPTEQAPQQQAVPPQAPAASSEQSTVPQAAATPQAGTETKAPAAKAQPQQQPKQEKAPAKK
jgi:preprotein translocase subunit SecG